MGRRQLGKDHPARGKNEQKHDWQEREEKEGENLSSDVCTEDCTEPEGVVNGEKQRGGHPCRTSPDAAHWRWKPPEATQGKSCACVGESTSDAGLKCGRERGLGGQHQRECKVEPDATDDTQHKH